MTAKHPTSKITRHRAGGRAPEHSSMPSLPSETADKTWMMPSKPSTARLTVVQVTDCYTLDFHAHLKTALKEIRAAQGGDRVVSMLTGDFLSPYLLSSVDQGKGMMEALAATPIEYLTWGNHEADINHQTVCKHVKNWPGKWINTNMQSHEAMEYQQPYEVIEITSPDGTQTRRIGLVAVLSNDPKLYSHFKAPGAFGGAKIEDPWETLRKYEKILMEDEKCDMILPLQHLYVPEDTKTCQEFDFPVILSGHDHHRIDTVINNTRLIKPGMDGVCATVLELSWEALEQAKPTVRSTFINTADYEPCPILQAQTDKAYDVLLPLRNTELAGVPSQYEPLSSKEARASVCSVGRLICSMLHSSMVQTFDDRLDGVILMGGNIRGGENYPPGSYFSLETLEQETKSDEVIGVVPIPGSVLAAGIEATHAGDPIPGWFQYDDGIKEQDGKVVAVGGKPLDPDRVYRVATKISDLTNGQSPPLKAYFEAHPELLPAKGSYVNIQSELMSFFARNLWRRLWDLTWQLLPEPVKEMAGELPEEVEGRLRLSVLDRDGDGCLTIDDIHYGLKEFLGLRVHDEEKTLAKNVHACADVTGGGMVTVEDFEQFCTGMPREFKLIRKWSDCFPEASSPRLPAHSRTSSAATMEMAMELLPGLMLDGDTSSTPSDDEEIKSVVKPTSPVVNGTTSCSTTKRVSPTAVHDDVATSP